MKIQPLTSLSRLQIRKKRNGDPSDSTARPGLPISRCLNAAFAPKYHPARALQPIEAQVAQLVEQRTENPRVGGSIPPLGTIVFKDLASIPEN